ncbi:MAG: serpin family protein [Clostridiales bacterium]|jgi:serine protease inhibitor|nr:serpin family protein [Clostridiales bacterium]
MKKFIVIILCLILITTTFTACDDVEEVSYEAERVNQGVLDGNSQFAFDIFKTVNKEDNDENIFISPLSISAALTMTYNGAETTTKEVMEQALGYRDIDRDVVNESYKYLLGYLENIDSKIELNIANSVWVREGREVKEEFLEKNRDSFNAQIESLDFSKDEAVDRINNWISDATKGKIDEMLEPPIAPDVIMYLINAIYFKGDWSEEFDPKDTREETFTTYEGKEQTVSMMSRTGKIDYAEGDDYKAVRLPYGKGKVSMYCVLPDEDMTIDDFIDNMTIGTWDEIRNKMSEVEELELKIPKFKIEYGIKKLNDSLIALGMGEAFTDRADFSGIMDNVSISRVLHKAVIEVNEEGSEAAAATVVEIRETAAMEPIRFIADRPFLFFISDDESGTILFMGKLLEIS